MEKKIKYRVTAEDVSMDVGGLLRKRIRLSEHQIRSAKFRPDGILCNGVRVRITRQVQEGDCLEVLLEQETAAPSCLAASPGRLDILYEDEDVLLVNKAAGIPVHPGHGHYRDTLANYLLNYFQEQGSSAVIRAVGRLDKETSGIVVFAKNKVAAARLTGKAVEKEYLALVSGRLSRQQGYIQWPVRKKPGTLNQMEISPEGSFAGTHYQVLREFSGFSLVQICLDTGRTHQIRVHMAALGHPLLGDRIYGETPGRRENVSPERAALHCWRVRMRQPFTGKEIFAEASLPEDMKRLIEEKKTIR